MKRKLQISGSSESGSLIKRGSSPSPSDEEEGTEAGLDYEESASLKTESQLSYIEAEHSSSFCRSAFDRGGWLSGLLIFQSFSSIILASYVGLIQAHPTIMYFLTALVGAGGNAGNQAAVRCIRGLALRTLNANTIKTFLWRDSTVEIVAIVISCIIIVIVSVLAGACLPLCLQRVGIDPAHASTTIQVIMDISGVAITMVVTTALLDSNFVSSMFKAFFLTENVDGMTHSE
eukprot:GSChrysophyteH1.ASY1.ANO1.890.1 assembled CDS